jgi:hypothetical protein
LLKRVRVWRQQAVQRLIGEVSGLPSSVASDPSRLAAGNILGKAAGDEDIMAACALMGNVLVEAMDFAR